MSPSTKNSLPPALVIVVALFGASCQKTGEPGASPQAETRAPDAKTPEVVATAGGAEMVLVPGGWFEMGSAGAKPGETPRHKVWVDAFLMDRCEVTQSQWDKLMLGNPSHFKGPNHPVEQISWAKAAEYCNARSAAEGLTSCYDITGKCDFAADGYRLPTEAEWEYACRAGTAAEFSFGSDARELTLHAWCAENAAKKTHPVGQKKPNSWGLFDLHGNVAEWCNDVYEAEYYQASPERNPTGPAEGEKYVLRGGAWNSKPETCRSAYRLGEDPGFQDACFARDAIGFRCVRKPLKKEAPAAGDKGAGEPGKSASQTPHSGRAGPASAFCVGIAGRALAFAVCGLALSALADTNAAKTGLVYSEIYLRHKTGDHHPERPQRLSAIVQRLEKAGLLGQLVRLEPQVAADEWIAAIHAPQYIQRVKAACRAGPGHMDSLDTPVSEDSYAAAVAAASGVLTAVDAVMEGKVQNAFCAVRPPGHHAMKSRAMGFCLLNNVAIAARYVQKKHKLAKVLIVDWDVHHGNGTQAAFYDDPSVLYFSVHRDHFYPGTGAAADKGEGAGLGYTVNVPLPAGSGDAQYLAAFAKTLRPAAEAFHPDFVLISAGFDAHKDDPLGGMQVTPQGYAEMTRIVKQIAATCCQGRLVSVLEGGYDLEALADSAEAHLKVMIGKNQ